MIEHQVEYIGSMAAGLAKMAKMIGLPTLAYLLDMAALEAATISQQRRPKGQRLM